jgi:hypothetical protein
MSHYILIRRLRWPAILLLVGVVALLHQAGAIDDFWRLFWPLLLILVGVLLLAERAALAAEGGYPPQPLPGAPYSGSYPGQYPGSYPGAPYSGAADANAPAGQAPAEPGSAIVPAPAHDLVKDPEGGQS